MSISGKIENLIRISWFKSDNATSLLAVGYRMLLAGDIQDQVGPRPRLTRLINCDWIVPVAPTLS